MKALICMAGEGKRLRPHTLDRPKALVKVGKRTILEYMLENISDCGIKDVILIIGYKADKVKSIIGDKFKNCRIKYYVNKDYDKTDNMFSLWMARSEIDEGVVFFNADIIFHKDILKKLLESPHEKAVAVDEEIELVDDAMKVKIIDRKIKAISKRVEAGNGWAMGIYKFAGEGAKQYYKEVENLVKSGFHGASFVRPVEIISQYDEVYSVNIGGLPWAEIDNLDDLEQAKKRVDSIVKE